MMHSMIEASQNRQWSQIVARAWSDPAFKSRLVSDPASVLREQGVELDSGVQVQVHESTERVCHFVLPPSPAEQLCEEELSASVALGTSSGHGRCGCHTSVS
jgi:hypothetical protein